MNIKFRNLRSCLTVCLLAFTIGTSVSQDFSIDYKPIRNFSPDDLIISNIEDRFKAWTEKSGIQAEKVKVKFAEMADQKARFLKALDSMQLIMYDDTISGFLNDVKDHLVSHNEKLKEVDYKIFTLRSAEPNAYSLGEGIIFVSLGLLERLKTIDQLAFVISHEIGHDIARHSFTEAKRYSQSYFSDDFQRILRKSNRKRAYRNNALNGMFTSFFANHMRYSRKNEIAADSLGFAFFTQSGYSPKGAIESLEILEASDNLRFTDTLDLRQYFNFEQYPFKPHWWSTANTSQAWTPDTTLFITPDSMKSHPDCPERIGLLEDQAPSKASTDGKDGVQLTALQNINTIVSFETLEALMQREDYAVALYICLHMQKEFPENKYLKAVTANCLVELAEALSENEYLSYVDFPNREYSLAYNKYLVFLHNMSSSTLRKLFAQYMSAYLTKETENSYVEYLRIIGDKETPITEESIKTFEEKYADAYLTDLLEERIKEDED